MSKKHILTRLRETLPLIYTSGVFDSIATDLGIEDLPLRGKQVYMLERLAPKVAFLPAADGDRVVKEAIAKWLGEQAKLPEVMSGETTT
jgi:hypothetical protein